MRTISVYLVKIMHLLVLYDIIYKVKYKSREEIMGSISIFQGIMLGLVQGLGEFLPISSSGHLALLQYFFNITGDKVLLFAVMLHIGTLISVFIMYWKDICALFVELIAVIKDVCTGKGFNINKNETRKLGFLIIVATIPTGIIGIFFEKMFTKFYGSFVAIGLGLILTGTVLFVAEKMGGGRTKAGKMKYRTSVFVGIMQGVAIAPGVSRSGSTLFGGLIAGLNREFAVKFAFLISIPSILGSAVLEFPKALSQGIDSSVWLPITLGMIVAAISGILAIKFMIKLVSQKRLSVFSFYTFILGSITLIYGLFFM